MEDETIVSAVMEQHAKALDKQCPKWALNLWLQCVVVQDTVALAGWVCHSLWCIRDTPESTGHEIAREFEK